MRHLKEVFTAKSGTGVSSEVTRKELGILFASQPVMAKVTLTYGTTITIQLQGRRLMSEDWETVAEETFTTGSPKYIHQTDHPELKFKRYRLNITANTGCTVTKGYIGCGSVEN